MFINRADSIRKVNIYIVAISEAHYKCCNVETKHPILSESDFMSCFVSVCCEYYGVLGSNRLGVCWM